MAGSERRASHPLAVPFVGSLALHAALALAVITARAPHHDAMPPIYNVDLVAAPPGDRAVGAVTPAPPPAPDVPTTPPTSAEQNPRDMPSPDATTKRAPPPATPNTAAQRPKKNAPAPKAGGGPVGGHGTDVANVHTEGTAFPYPGYLNNIVRQIALQFKPDNPNAPLHADVFFIIHRDGSISGMRYMTRSGNYSFDLEAQGAIEAAAQAHAFGPLPAGYPEDYLPVVFSFDPSLLR